jgi:hypothetical protein
MCERAYLSIPLRAHYDRGISEEVPNEDLWCFTFDDRCARGGLASLVQSESLEPLELRNSRRRVDGPLAEGRRGKMTTDRGSKHEVTFHGVIEGRGFSMSMSGPPLTTFTFTCEIAREGTGSAIAQHVAITGPLAFLFGPMMGNEMAKHFVPVLDDLARTAESAAP